MVKLIFLETTSPEFIENWVSNLEFEQVVTLNQITRQTTNEVVTQGEPTLQCKYTDVVIIGGDGLVNSYVNAIYNHHYSKVLLDIPLGILPGGSANSLCCDLGGENPLHAAVHIIRANRLKGDFMKIEFGRGKTVIANALGWGFFGEVTAKAEGWRTCLGTSRYNLCGARQVF